MTVEPGFGGQSLIPKTLDKVAAVRGMIRKKGLQVDVEVDGGIHLGNIAEVVRAGANVIVSGSSVFKGDITKNVTDLLEKGSE